MRVFPVVSVLAMGLAALAPAAQAAFVPGHLVPAGHHHGGLLLPPLPGSNTPPSVPGNPAPVAVNPGPGPLGALPQQLLQQVFQQALTSQAAKSSQAAPQAAAASQAAPDLFPTSFGSSGNACELRSVNHHLAIVAHVHNQGNAAAPASNTLVTFRRVQGDQQVAVHYAMVPTPAIAAGGQAALGASTVPAACAASGSCSAVIAVNSEQAIRESNYQNNSIACLVSPRAQ